MSGNHIISLRVAGFVCGNESNRQRITLSSSWEVFGGWIYHSEIGLVP